MPQNGYSVGRDVTLVLQTSTGPLSIPKITNFTRKQDATVERVKRIDGITETLRFFDGWSGSLQAKRNGPEIDRYFGTLEDNYYSGLTEVPAQIFETVQEPNGAISQFRYDGVMLTLENAGDVVGDASIALSLSFTATRRRVVA